MMTSMKTTRTLTVIIRMVVVVMILGMSELEGLNP